MSKVTGVEFINAAYYSIGYAMGCASFGNPPAWFIGGTVVLAFVLLLVGAHKRQKARGYNERIVSG